MWLGKDPAIIRDPACIAYLIYTVPASKQDPALIWTRLINGHIRYFVCLFSNIYLFIWRGILWPNSTRPGGVDRICRRGARTACGPQPRILMLVAYRAYG